MTHTVKEATRLSEKHRATVDRLIEKMVKDSGDRALLYSSLSDLVEAAYIQGGAMQRTLTRLHLGLGTKEDAL